MMRKEHLGPLPIRIVVGAALAAFASGCLGASLETDASRAEPGQAPATDVQRLCVDPTGVVGRCAATRVTIDSRGIFVRDEPARELMEMLVRGTRRTLPATEDASMIPPRNEDGIAYMGQQSEDGSEFLMCYQIETDTLCGLFLDASVTATTEVRDGAELPTTRVPELADFEVSGNTSRDANLTRLAWSMVAAVAPIDQDGYVTFPESGVLELSFGHWGCTLRLPPGATTDEVLDASCRLTRESAPLPPEPAPRSEPAPAN